MKLSKTNKIILLGTTLGILAAAIAIPVVLLNANENNDQEKQSQKDVNNIVKILEEKTGEEKIIELPSDASDKIIANNQEKIIEKIKALIGQSNLKAVKIEVSMQNDTNISTSPQKIIIKLTKNKVSKEIKDFSVKKQLIVEIDKDIESIKRILDAKTGNDLIIILPSKSNGNIIGNTTNKNEIIKKLRILIDPSNTNGQANHSSLRGTTIDISMSTDAPISTVAQAIIVSISKTSGTTLRTTKIFQVKRKFTADEDIAAIKKILNAKTGNDLLITLPRNSTGSIINNPTNKNTTERKIRILIDSSNKDGDHNHPSLRGTTITLTKINSFIDDLISGAFKSITIRISKPGGTSLIFTNFVVTKANN